MNESWCMYVVECSDGSLYCGVSTDVQRRVRQHNTSSRGAKYTRSRRPVCLLHVEHFDSQSAALKAEAAFKRMSRAQKLERVRRGM